MSETYRQQAFGQPTFTDGHASGSSSGHDLFDILDAANLYHDHEYHPGGQHLQPLQIPTQNDIAQNQHFAYALHASGVSAPGLQYTSPTMPTMTGHIPQHFEHDSTLQIGFDDLQGFSPVTQGFSINAYRTKSESFLHQLGSFQTGWILLSPSCLKLQGIYDLRSLE
jgi:hypothetical protein